MTERNYLQRKGIQSKWNVMNENIKNFKQDPIK